MTQSSHVSTSPGNRKRKGSENVIEKKGEKGMIEKFSLFFLLQQLINRVGNV